MTEVSRGVEVFGPPGVVIAFNRVGDDADAASRDVLDQVALVEEGLADLGWRWRRLAVMSSGPWRRRLLHGAGLVVNLVESPPGNPGAQVRFAEFLERTGLPFTGSGSAAIALTTDKVAARSRLGGAGVPVAPGGVVRAGDTAVLATIPPPWLVKPSCEDASVGLEGNPVCASPAEVAARAAALSCRFPGQEVLVEQFLPGREFNVSLLQVGSQVRVLPVAEIEYREFPAGEPQVLGWAAKWEPHSFAYGHTVRVFPSPVEEGELLDELAGLACASWRACGCRGYARVDLRLGPDGRPRVLEVNTNPCLSADAGFMAAVLRAGLSPGEVVSQLAAGARWEEAA